MAKEDYREKIEEDRQEIEMEGFQSRASRSKQKGKKRKNPLISSLLVIFIFIPSLVLLYVNFLYEPDSPVETVEQNNEVVQVEKNDTTAKAAVVEDDEEEKDEKDTSSDTVDISDEKQKELAAAQAAAAAEASKAAEQKAKEEAAKKAAEQKAKEEAAKKAAEQKAKEEAAKPKRTHTVKSNETLYRIAMNYYNDPSAVEKIKQANGMASESIQVGQTLILP
ncbi:LysM peptidoglycan-binding domain-containing protein [Lysinibacillus sp. 3P01SB]|uniref:LysM peptidoglycan-binding domain-containing protein n=1 Tax=Lysinibacillus sp. 3P01SB TaxID=3132284 RepID=UPI0039A62E29